MNEKDGNSWIIEKEDIFNKWLATDDDTKESFITYAEYNEGDAVEINGVMQGSYLQMRDEIGDILQSTCSFPVSPGTFVDQAPVLKIDHVY